MIWSLIKVLVFVAAVAALTFGAGLLMDNGSGVRIAIADMELTLGPLQAVIAALLLVLAVWIFLKLVGFTYALLRFLNGDETAISRYFDRSREKKGYQALAEGMMALAAGEPRTAMSRASKAEKYLGRPELTNLLMAQAAEQSGDSRRATEAYKTLLNDERTRFVGIRGLMKQKIEEGDTATALQLAEKAFALKPRHPETQDILLKLQADRNDWTGARSTLSAKRKSGALPKAVYQRRDAVLALQTAKVVFDDASSIEAREAAIAANKQSPDLIPAAAMAARSYIAQGNPKYATRVLKKAWEAQPHPDLAAAFAEIEPDETPTARLKRFRTLTSIHPENDETRMLLAELSLTAEDFPAARRALGDLVTRHPTTRALTIMAAVERGEGADDAVVRGWLARALTAPRGPQWCCDNCQSIHAAWGPICDNCGGFDTLSWREPAETSAPSATGTELLPLIVGSPASATDPAMSGEVIDEEPTTARPR
ncbi:heme biosynthesis protein HemY [Cereibacter changlensis JA139]|uniref:Heme biosynthesis protein HemY n=2 Tax=Cereibacter changlensis TaxID=402884 RepID=A0A2T4JXR4_9RHOB|nr:heme biosynthesis HemY N-terminal domain-containing protein [Cereibacter changlensis]PTE22666.1 heme biosynthesis protein HemY [Cereibacter changlensis JA139]PZX58953.1 HemY protein [Cereibacter changlensis]